MSHPSRSARLRALALACAVLPGPALAQQTAAPFADVPRGGEAAVSLAEISVTATGVPTLVARTGSSVTVLTADLIEAQQRRTAPDALQQVPGLNVVQTGGPGGQTSVFIRGTNANHVKTFIDGIDVSDPANFNRSFDYGQLLTDDLARIEVLRGPQSGLYGADALGGVISFVTKRGEGPARATATVEGGSFGTFNQNGRVSGSEGIVDYAVSVQHLRSDATPVTPRDLVPSGRRINPNFYDNRTVSAKFGAQLTDAFRLNQVVRFTDAQLLFTGDSGFPSLPNQFRSLSDVQQVFTRTEAEWTPLAGFHNVFGFNYANAFTVSQGPLDPLSTPAAATGLGERARFDYRGDYRIAPGHLFVFGAQREDESLLTNDPVFAGRLRASNGNTAGFGEIQSALGDRIFLVANLRHDKNDQFGAATTFRVAPSMIVPGTETRLKASVGTGFKPPTLVQLYQSFPAFNSFANPNLRPEESLGFDAGAEQPLLDGRVVVGGLYYENDFRNLIQSVFAPDFSTSENVGRALSYGAEAFVSVKVSDTLSGRVDYTNTVTKDEITNQELLRRPRHKVSTTALWTPLPNLTLTGTLIVIGSFVDGNRDFSIARLRNPGYILVNLAASYALSEAVTLFARIDNLFDQRYQNPTGFLGPGLAVYGGARLTTF